MPQVRAIASHRLESLSTILRTETSGRSAADEAHSRLLARDIQRFLERPSQPFGQPAARPIPPGAPIGDPGMQWLPPSEPVCSQPEW